MILFVIARQAVRLLRWLQSWHRRPVRRAGGTFPGAASGRAAGRRCVIAASAAAASASGRVASFKEIAQAEGVSEQFVSNRISFAFLAPQIVESIHAGTQPADLTADALVKRIEIPLAWSE